MSFQRFAGTSAFAVAAGGIAYAVAFVVAVKTDPGAAETIAALLLLVGGLLGSAVLAGLYQRIRGAEPGFALWGLLLGAVGVIGSAIHGGFDLALQVHPAFDVPGIPNEVDPRGLLTFGVTGLGVLVLSWVIRQGSGLPPALGTLGMALGVLLVGIFVARLFILDTNNLFLLALAGVTGAVVHPVWFVWLGRSLRQGTEQVSSSPPGGT
ncbi:MAG TPA: hypothetical protein VFZ45_02200 [Actinomycetota bacterium]|nr:hypothetical protein [Actinomycetota bacterium]